MSVNPKYRVMGTQEYVVPTVRNDGCLNVSADDAVTSAIDPSSQVKAYDIWGENVDLDTSSGFEDVWAFGGERAWPTSAETLSITSSSASDTAAGTGAQTLSIEGLDAGYSYIEETVTLNGTSAVTTTNSYLRLNYAEVATVGSNGATEGNITIKNSTSDQTLGYIKAGNNETRLTQHTTPANTSSVVLRMWYNSQDSIYINFQFQFRKFGGA